MLKRSWLFTSTYITNIACIYGVLVPYTPHMNSWVLDEWLYYEILQKITELNKKPLQTKRKNHIRIRSIDVLLWIHDYGVTYTSFSSGFPEKNYLTNYNTRFHSCIRNICYQVHWGNFIEFTLTLTPCPF